MSTVDREELFNIGGRLRDERVRLGYSQETFGTRIGTTGRTVKKYEANETSPRASELLTAYSAGMDVFYVITGDRLPLGVREDRAEYSPAEHVAEEIRDLSLAEPDARIIAELARRLATQR